MNSQEAQREYNWQRRWIPVYEGGSDRTGATAREREAQALWQLRFTTEGVLFGKIRHVPCLILLGEPGLGKSHFVEREEHRLSTYLKNSADESILRNLAKSESGDGVQQLLFDNDRYRNWKAGTHRLTLFVDSVDQAGISVERVITIIRNELADADVSRLHLRLVCRDHDWSLTLANTLEHVWRNDGEKESNVRIYQLAPLGPDDIRVAVEANRNNIEDPERFLKEIKNEDAWALATVPITLEMLLEKPGYLTSSRTELYEHGLRRLCRGTQSTAELPYSELDRRFEIASRIAAVMVLSRKQSVDVKADDVYDSSRTLILKDLLLDLANTSEVDPIRATLETGLFKGEGKREWRHSSYAAYMTARHLSNKNIPVKDILDMTVAPDKKFPSHLHDTLRWLIEMRMEVLPEVVKRQPMLILAADLSHLSADKYRALFDALLSLDDPYVYSHETWNLRNVRAGHDSAKSVLLPYLTDTRRSPYLRRFVLDLIEHLDIEDIDNELVHIVLDENEDQVLRRLAARRICDAGSDESKLQLKSYIQSREDDPEDQLKGYALQSLWPDLLTADELFNALSPPKKKSSGHIYRTFLYGDSILDGLQPADLLTALEWVTTQRSHHETPFPLREMPGKIMRKAWDNIHVSGVLEAFTRTAVEMNARFDGIFGGNAYDMRFSDEEAKYYDKFAREVEARRQVVTTALPIWREKDTATNRLMRGRQSFLLTSDLEWLIGLLDVSTEPDERCQLANIIADLFRWLSGSYASTSEENYRRVERVYNASDRHPELQQLVQRYSITMLDDPDVVSHREHIRQMREIDEDIARQRAEVRPFERLQEALDRMEAGETWQWINVCLALTSIPSEMHTEWGLKSDLTDFPTWQSRDDEMQERITRAAKSYVMSQDVVPTDDNSEDWYETPARPRIDDCAYLAIFLLQKVDVNALSQLPADCWKRWSKIIVWYPNAIFSLDGRTDYHREIRGIQQELMRKLHENAPRALMDNLRTLLVAQDRLDSYIGQKLREVGHLWDSELEGVLLRLVRDSNLSPRGQRSILDFLLAKESADAQRVAEAQISKGYADQNEKDLVVEFSVSLMTSESEFNWTEVWKLFENDAVGRAIVGKLAEEDRNTAKIPNKLSVTELVNLLIWMEEQYPTSEDPRIDGVHAVTTREQVSYLRNDLIAELRNRNSREALDGVWWILSQFPELERLEFVRLDLEKAVEGSEPEPTSPKEVTDWLSRYQRQRLGKLECAWRLLKKHKGSILILLWQEFRHHLHQLPLF